MTENMDRENTMFEVEDTIDKIKFLVDDFMEQYSDISMTMNVYNHGSIERMQNEMKKLEKYM